MSSLFEPVVIGNLELRNRIVMPAMCTCFASVDGEVTRRLIDYYVERAKGGVGLIIVEATNVDFPQGSDQFNKPAIDHDRYIAGLGELAEAVQFHGARVAIQLHHAGRQTTQRYTDGRQPVAPSDVPCKMTGSQPRTLTIKEIEELVEKFSDGARRAKEAGFDAVEIHGAHGYLISSFMSPYTNKRTDRYGGDFENRVRFPLEIVKRTREKVGHDFPIIFRMNGEDYLEGGLKLENTKVIAKKLQEAGVNAIHVSAAMAESRVWQIQPGPIPLGVNVHLAQGIKESVSIPVIAVGRINDPDQANKIVEEGKADLVSMGRALIADPELPRKGVAGKNEDIRKCIACLRGCLGHIFHHQRMSCTVNVAVGKEKDFAIIPAPKSKRVLVVGGGPAGMEAARVAALRKHDVILCERSENLGGQLNLAIIPPFKEDLRNVHDFLTNQINKLKVKVTLGMEVTPEFTEEVNADAVIVATGGKPLLPDIEGIREANALIGWEVLQGKGNTGKSAIIAGGGEVGCQIGEFLLERGTQVTIVEMLEDLALDAEQFHRQLLLERLSKHGARINTNTVIDRVFGGGVQGYRVTHSLEKRTFEAESVVLALGTAPENELYKSLSGGDLELYAVGDCVNPRNMLNAIHEASFVARQI